MTVVANIVEFNKSLYRYCDYNSNFSKVEIEDLIQHVWYKCYIRIHEKQELMKKALEEKNYFKYYVRKALKHTFINELRKLKRPPIRSEIEIHADKPIITEKPIEDDDAIEELMDPIELTQRQDAINKFFTKLRSSLSEDENEFLDIALEKSANEEKLNISEIGLLVAGNALKGHDILRRIQRKAKDIETRHRYLKYVSAPGKKSALQLFDIFSESIEPDMYDDSNRVARDITNNVLKKLGPDALGILAKFF